MPGNPVTHSECSAKVQRVIDKVETLDENIGREIKYLKVTLAGKEGRNGLIADVNFLMNRSQVMNAIGAVLVGIVSSVITAIILGSVVA